jgi:hypothetical protein
MLKKINKKIIWSVLSVLALALIIFAIFYFRGNEKGWSSKQVSTAADCSRSGNRGVKKSFLIALADIKEENIYKTKRQEAVSLINQCYEVKLTEEYEVNPGEISTQAGTFSNKISNDTRVFDKLKFYPELELLDYEGVALDGGLTYVYAGDYETLFNFYANMAVEGYKQTPTPEETELIWTDIDTAQKLLTVKFTRVENGKTLLNFDFSEPLAVATSGQTASGFGNSQIEKAITDYLLSQKTFSWQTAEDSKNFCVIKNLLPENELFPLYIWARCGEFILQNDEVKELSGTSLPVKIDYPNELSYYDLNKFSYEIPRDGSANGADIEKIFPSAARKNFSANNEMANMEIKTIAADNLKNSGQ